MEIKGKRQRNINRETESERQAMKKTELNLNKFETGNTVLRSKPPLPRCGGVGLLFQFLGDEEHI